jgi:N-dimethylarginine dimethylaminohydrolase
MGLRIRLCLMHRPGDEMNIIDPAMRIDEIGSFGDREKGWYFPSDVIPDWDEFRAQHDALVQLLRDEGVEVVFLDDVEEDGIKSVYTRDSSIAIKGGALVTRLARSIRRGEEAHVSKTLAGLGMPILRTLHGTALMEGGSFAWLNSKTAVIARSICVNDEGCDQVEQVLNAQGAELLRIDMTGYDIHIDGALTMIDVDLAIVDPDLLPYGFLRKLDDLGVRTVEIDEHDDPWIVNCLAVSPGRIIMPPGISSKTEAALQRLNQEVIEIDYDKIQLNGGGIHCSTCPLIRDSVD